LVKKAGWTEADIRKNAANIMRLDNHAVMVQGFYCSFKSE
jgi:hypothetical protein